MSPVYLWNKLHKSQIELIIVPIFSFFEIEKLGREWISLCNEQIYINCYFHGIKMNGFCWSGSLIMSCSIQKKKWAIEGENILIKHIRPLIFLNQIFRECCYVWFRSQAGKPKFLRNCEISMFSKLISSNTLAMLRMKTK